MSGKQKSGGGKTKSSESKKRRRAASVADKRAKKRHLKNIALHNSPAEVEAYAAKHGLRIP